MIFSKSYRLVLPAFIFLASCAATRTSAVAETDTVSESNKIKLVQATSQRTLGGAPGSEPVTDYRFLIVWNDKSAPETFYWKNTEGWQPCRVMRVTKAERMADGQYKYSTAPVTLSQIGKGDMLELYALRGEKNSMLQDVPTDVTKSIFFQTNKSDNWLYTPVTDITRLPEVVMP